MYKPPYITSAKMLGITFLLISLVFVGLVDAEADWVASDCQGTCYIDDSDGMFHTIINESGKDHNIVFDLSEPFYKGDSLEYDLNYISGSGNRVHIIFINMVKRDSPSPVGYWNGDMLAGNSPGRYRINVTFLEDYFRLSMMSPDGNIFEKYFNLTVYSEPYMISLSTKTGYDGTVHMSYGNLKKSDYIIPYDDRLEIEQQKVPENVILYPNLIELADEDSSLNPAWYFIISAGRVLLLSFLILFIVFLFFRRKRKSIRGAMKSLDDAREKIMEGKSPKIFLALDRDYVIKYKEAAKLFNSGKFYEAEDTAKESLKLFKRHKRFEKEREKLKRLKIERERLEREEKLERERQERFERAQRKRGLIKYKGEWMKPREAKKRKEIEIGLHNNFADLSPYEFEHFIAKLFGEMGYHTKVTPGSGDYGVDVVARKGDETIAIQAKRFTSGTRVGNRDVQMLLGAMGMKGIDANKAILITNSYFTRQAEEQARGRPIELWDKKTLHEMVVRVMLKEM